MVDHHIRISDRSRADVDPEVAQYPPALAIEPRSQQLEQISRDERVPHRAAGHHQDMPPGQFVTPLATLDPGEERSLVHLQIRLDVHGRLFSTNLAVPVSERKGARLVTMRSHHR